MRKPVRREGRIRRATFEALATTWIVSWLAASPCAAQGAGARLRVEVAPREITVGDRVEAKVTLVWTGPEPAGPPRFPAWQETWGDAEVLAAGEVETLSDGTSRHIYRQTLVLTAFATGGVELPEITVAMPLAGETVEAGSDPAGFEVRSVLPEGGAGDLGPRDPASLVALPSGGRFAGTAVALAGLTLAVVWFLARRLRRAVADPAARPLPEPLEELLERLRRLDPRAAEPAHTGLSHALRRFLGRSLGLRAVEGTTSEIGRQLRHAPVAPAVARGTVSVLRDCDRVKFARAPCAAAQTEGRLCEARRLAREIDGGLRPAATPEAAG